MRKYTIFFAFITYCFGAIAQSTPAAISTASSSTSATISGLAVPASPAFSITDITPTLVQNPTTPKAFALGVAQSFSQSGTAFPNNYSAEFAPIWWINPKGVNVYSYLGLKQPDPAKAIKDNSSPRESGGDVVSGINFTTISVAFLNKDLIPDTSTKTQNIFSIGLHTILIKVYTKGYSKELIGDMKKWHTDAIFEENANAYLIDEESKLNPNDSAYSAKLLALEKKYTEIKTPDDLKAINQLIAQKPVFSWDLAGAWAVYGLNNNQQIKTGRAGVWTSLSYYKNLDAVKTNFFNINVLGRYLLDNFQKNANGVIGTANNIDVGGNLGFDFNRLSINVESLYRFTNGVPNTENRTVGIISVKLTDKIFINGTFGKDFAGPNKLISVFGINWGFGNEQLSSSSLP